MNSIDMYIDEANELVFNVMIEATEPMTPRFRFVIASDEMALAFEGRAGSDGSVEVKVPPLDAILSEGAYDSSLEVILNDKLIVPLRLDSNFKRSAKVTVESVKANVVSVESVKASTPTLKHRSVVTEQKETLATRSRRRSPAMRPKHVDEARKLIKSVKK